MNKIDKIVFGDNQFFGINHMSQEKAQQLAEKFYKTENIIKIYDDAIDAGIKSIMLNSNERAKEICDYFRDNKEKYSDINWYPSLPYPHKYANLVAEKGILPAINDMIFSDNSASGIFGMIAKGGSALVTKDAIKLMKLLIDIEMKTFKGLNVKVVFLQNIISDLILGYDIKDIFIEYADYIREKYNALPGFLTMNMPHLLNRLEEWGIEEAVICTSINKIGYLMSPDNKAYEETLKEYDRDKYQIMAMSTLASGAIPPNEAFKYIGNLNIKSVVFGASSKKNIVQSVELINKFIH